MISLLKFSSLNGTHVILKLNPGLPLIIFERILFLHHLQASCILLFFKEVVNDKQYFFSQ